MRCCYKRAFLSSSIQVHRSLLRDSIASSAEPMLFLEACSESLSKFSLATVICFSASLLEGLSDLIPEDSSFFLSDFHSPSKNSRSSPVSFRIASTESRSLIIDLSSASACIHSPSFESTILFPIGPQIPTYPIGEICSLSSSSDVLTARMIFLIRFDCAVS